MTFRALACLAVTIAAGHAGWVQQTAALTRATAVHAGPSLHATVLMRLARTRPITGEQTTLPVEASARAGGRRWFQVLLPGRPNGRRGWIAAGSAKLSSTPWRLTIDLSARRVSVFRNGSRLRTFRAIVGKPSTPTPVGSFFV